MKTQLKPTSTSKSAETTIIWTIGHSNRSIETFLELLKEHNIEVLVDVRNFPTSKIDHFKCEEMERWLPERGVEYVWLGEELDGYRRGGYRAHIKTKLRARTATQRRTCIMCMKPNQ